MKLLVDNREHQIIELLKTSSSKMAWEVSQLEVGDFQFIDDKGQCELVIERKTYADLASSIQGGRYKEQKVRLLAFPAKVKAYLIEGSPNYKSKFSRINSSTLDSALLGIAIRDGFRLIPSNGLEHSAELLVKLYSKLNEWQSEAGDPQVHNYASLVKVNKKENMDPKVCYLVQLKTIPGVSDTMAEHIASSYPTMWKLVKAINQQPVETQHHLSNLVVGTRKLGPAVAQRMVDYFKDCPEKPIIKLKTIINP